VTREDEYFFFDVIVHGACFLVDGHWAAFTTYNTITLAANR